MAQMLTGNSWDRVREIIRKRDRETCQYCGNEASDGEVDHVLPLSLGGHDGTDNLVWCCQACNLSKSDLTLREWIKKLVKDTMFVGASDIPPAVITVGSLQEHGLRMDEDGNEYIEM